MKKGFYPLKVVRLHIDEGVPLLNEEFEQLRGSKIQRIPGDHPVTSLASLLRFTGVERKANKWPIISDRNSLKKLLGMHGGKVSVRVKRDNENQVLWFFIEHQLPDGTYEDGHGTSDDNKSFSNGFESLMTLGWSEIGYHTFTRVDIDKQSVFLRCEVDCVERDGKVVELKMRGSEIGRWTMYWPYFQMYFGSVDNVITGFWKADKNDRILTGFDKKQLDQFWNDEWERKAKHAFRNLEYILHDVQRFQVCHDFRIVAETGKKNLSVLCSASLEYEVGGRVMSKNILLEKLK
jgi:hypothetical protein